MLPETMFAGYDLLPLNLPYNFLAAAGFNSM